MTIPLGQRGPRSERGPVGPPHKAAGGGAAPDSRPWWPPHGLSNTPPIRLVREHVRCTGDRRDNCPAAHKALSLAPRQGGGYRGAPPTAAGDSSRPSRSV